MKMETPNCTQLDSMLAMAPGEAFQDRDSWRKLAFKIEEQYGAVVAKSDELAKALKHLHLWLTDLSYQSESSAAYNLEKLHRGHCPEYNAAGRILSNLEREAFIKAGGSID